MSDRQEELRDVGLKATLPRIRILQMLDEKGQTDRHFTVEDLYKELMTTGDTICLPTVYRVLSQFEQAGLVIRHQFDSNTAVYELASDEHHDHMMDLDNNEIIEFNDPVIEARQREIAEEKGYTLIDHSLVMYVQRRKKKKVKSRRAG
ncbi:MAG: ferric iron uptake transcriptional regulator [Pseudomonadota bacterium]